MKQSLLVKKFGGTSVGTLERIEAVAEQIIQEQKLGHQLVVVVSAMNGETDRLINLAYCLSKHPEPRELAALVTTGEQVSMALLTIALQNKGVRAKSYNASQIAITTDNAYHKALIHKIDIQKISADLENHYIVIIAGFQGLSPTGDTTTLGRGGSDTSAVALAGALHANECQIYTDVAGIYTADPRLIPKAYCLEQIAFDAMLELANLGSKVLQWRSVALAGKYQIPLRVLSSFQEGPGTLIHYTDSTIESPQFTGISHQYGLTRFVITVNKTNHAILTTLAQLFAQKNVRLEHINQAVIDNARQISILVSHEEQPAAEEILNPMLTAAGLTYRTEKELARVALVGMGLRSHAWVAEKFLAVLHNLDIFIQEFIFSELSLSAIINKNQLAIAAPALHAAFFE